MRCGVVLKQTKKVMYLKTSTDVFKIAEQTGMFRAGVEVLCKEELQDGIYNYSKKSVMI